MIEQCFGMAMPPLLDYGDDAHAMSWPCGCAVTAFPWQGKVNIMTVQAAFDETALHLDTIFVTMRVPRLFHNIAIAI